jgi:hypothetical protein
MDIPIHERILLAVSEESFTSLKSLAETKMENKVIEIKRREFSFKKVIFKPRICH